MYSVRQPVPPGEIRTITRKREVSGANRTPTLIEYAAACRKIH